MSIWVDADACPNIIKEILFRAATRKEVTVTFVANQYIKVPPSPWIKMTQVSSGFDVADDYIAQQAGQDDLVVTSDIPLASEVIAKGAKVINVRGEKLTKDNIGARLNMRDFMDTMRSSGEMSGGPPAMGQREKQAFANALDQYLAKHS